MAARVGAAAAVFFWIAAALVGAGRANGCAHPANFVHEPGASAHDRGGCPAEGRTVMIQPDAIDLALGVLFTQTGSRTVFALLGTLHASIDTRLMLLVSHGGTW